MKLLLLLALTLTLSAKPYVFFSDCDPVIDHLIRWIDREKEGIDIAIYSFTHRRVEEALVRASRRGVVVRVVLDSSSEKMAKSLLDQGIDCVALVGSPKGGYRPLFHHKFILFRQNQKDRSWVWTGSFNLSNAAENRNFENVILTDHSEVFKKYATYFDKIIYTIENKASI